MDLIRLPPLHFVDTARHRKYLCEDLVELTSRIRQCNDAFVSLGGFANVSRGYLAPRNRFTLNSKRLVAIKILRVDSADVECEKYWKRLNRELLMWKQLRHANVVPLYGIAYGFGPLPAMVCPWFPGGNLTSFLMQNNEHLTICQRRRMVQDVLDGLGYLHDYHGVIHGDISGANVLVDEQGFCSLTDFGLSISLADETQSGQTSSLHGTVRYAAPELFNLNAMGNGSPRRTKSSDIYSLGSLVLQIFTGKIPWLHLPNDWAVLISLHERVRHPRPVESLVTDLTWSIICRCWALEPDDRPTVAAVSGFMDIDILRSKGTAAPERWPLDNAWEIGLYEILDALLCAILLVVEYFADVTKRAFSACCERKHTPYFVIIALLVRFGISQMQMHGLTNFVCIPILLTTLKERNARAVEQLLKPIAAVLSCGALSSLWLLIHGVTITIPTRALKQCTEMLSGLILASLPLSLLFTSEGKRRQHVSPLGWMALALYGFCLSCSYYRHDFPRAET